MKGFLTITNAESNPQGIQIVGNAIEEGYEGCLNVTDFAMNIGEAVATAAFAGLGRKRVGFVIPRPELAQKLMKYDGMWFSLAQLDVVNGHGKVDYRRRYIDIQLSGVHLVPASRSSKDKRHAVNLFINYDRVIEVSGAEIERREEKLKGLLRAVPSHSGPGAAAR